MTSFLTIVVFACCVFVAQVAVQLDSVISIDLMPLLTCDLPDSCLRLAILQIFLPDSVDSKVKQHKLISFRSHNEDVRLLLSVFVVKHLVALDLCLYKALEGVGFDVDDCLTFVLVTIKQVDECNLCG